MKIIVFSDLVPRPDMSSGERRFAAFLELLAKDHQVDLCVTDRWPQPAAETETHREALRAKGVRVVSLSETGLRKVLSHQSFDACVFEFYHVAERFLPWFWIYQPQAVTITDSVDVHYGREEKQAELGLLSRRTAARTRKRELRVYRNSDLVVAVSEEDVTLLEKELNADRIIFIPNIVPSQPRSDMARDPIAVFIGSYAWPPNTDAVKWFTREIWPMVHARRSDARFQIIGSSVTDEIRAMEKIPGVEVIGYVPQTGPYLEQAAVSVAPLRYGGGMKGKVNEALSHGIPVVTTSVGAQGFHAVNGVEMFISDEPAEFAAFLLRLLDDHELQGKMGLAGQALNERLCSPEAVAAGIDRMSSQAGSIKPLGKARRSWIKPFLWLLIFQWHSLAEALVYTWKKIAVK